MENMQNVRDALDALGVKTCLACGKAGAKSLCMGCRSVSFCGWACQKEAWRGHKKACRRVQRERARVLDKAAADYAADEAMAADACRADIPEGAECYICMNQTSYGQLRGDLVRMCSCRGPHAGFVHIRCLVANAEVRGEDGDDEAYWKASRECSQCRQYHRGA